MVLKYSSSSGMTKAIPTLSVKAAKPPMTALRTNRLRRAQYTHSSVSNKNVLAGMVQVSRQQGGRIE